MIVCALYPRFELLAAPILQDHPKAKHLDLSPLLREVDGRRVACHVV